VLLPILLPWTAWFGFWRGVARHVRVLDRETRLLLIWIVVPLVVMTFVSAKQAQYLLPMFPAVALLTARIAAEPATRRSDVWLPAGLVLLLGFLLVLIPVAANAIQIGLGLDDLPGWIDEVSVIPGITLLVLGGGLIVAGRRSPANQVTLLAAISPVLFLSLHLGVLPAMARIYGVDSTAALIARVQAQGRSVAYLGKYHGQFQFVGRLERPLDVVSYPDLDGWLATHPDGYVVAVLKDPGPDARDAAAHVAPYRSRVLTVWAVHDAIAHRDLFR
jgi:4-amino-4-deoxy-L-arabinose transferase-like glycosyltransferase